MATEIIAVYQDCVLCGVKGKQKIAEYAEKGVNIRKVSFVSDEGRELCAEALKKGIGSMPFYVCDGEYATSIEALIAKKSADKPKKLRETSKTISKKQKMVQGAGDGANTEI